MVKPLNLSLEKYAKEKDRRTRESKMNTKLLGTICFYAGFVSIFASIAIWVISKEPDTAHGERFGIFVGLWAPTFMSLSNRWK